MRLGRRGEGRGSPHRAAAAGAAAGGPSGGAPAPLHGPPGPTRHPRPRAAEPGRAAGVTAGPRGAGPAAFPAAPRPLRPFFPAAPGHAAPRAGAGFSPARPPARPPHSLGTQPIGQAREPPHPDWWERCPSAGEVAVPRRAQLAPPIPAQESGSPGIPGVSLPEAGFQACPRLRSYGCDARWVPGRQCTARPHAPGSLSRRRAPGGAHAEAGAGSGCAGHRDPSAQARGGRVFSSGWAAPRACSRAPDALEMREFETWRVAAFLPRSLCPQSGVQASPLAEDAVLGLKPGKSIVWLQQPSGGGWIHHPTSLNRPTL